MSTPFTAVTSTHLQDLALFHEILLAYLERYGLVYAVPRQDPPGPFDLNAVLPAGSVAHNTMWFYNHQVWLENYWLDFLDYTVTAPDPLPVPGNPPWLTLARWREIAGLPAGGFRRVPGTSWPADWTNNADPAYTFGTSQGDDIFGPWLIVDLQRGYGALRRFGYFGGDFQYHPRDYNWTNV